MDSDNQKKFTLYPTCDSYVLAMLQQREEENSKLHEHIRQLNAQIDELKHSKEKTDRHYIDVDNKIGVYYSGGLDSTYGWNEWLKKQHKTPEYIDELVKNESEFKKLASASGDTWSHSVLWWIHKNYYYKTITAYNGKIYAVYDSYGGSLSMVELKGSISLNYYDAYTALREEFLEEAKKYKKEYASKFEPEPSTEENK